MSFFNQLEKFCNISSFILFYNFVCSKFISALEHIFYFALVYFCVCLGFYKLIFLCAERCNIRLLNLIRFEKLRCPILSMNRVAIIICHPDDESMFFGPIIQSLNQFGNKLYLLCLSQGNYEKQGNQRRRELFEACKVLGIPEENITLYSCTHLPDDPGFEWRVQTVANIIANTVDSLDIQAIITFDRDGVSQHPNHTAVYYAAASLCLNNLLPKECKLFTLDSINTFRKYISLFDLLITSLISTHWCVLSFQEASKIRKAMIKHKSQMKWFRWLYIFFSRYMFINSLREMTISDIELEMQIQDTT